MDSITWLRPEYKGREDELINLSAAADLVGVTRSTVSNWSKRHADDFPGIVLLTGLGDRRHKYIPRDEFLDFARVQLSKRVGTARKRTPRHRPVVVLRGDQIAHSERQIARLAELETRQAATLANTRKALRKHRVLLKKARQELAAETAAVHALAAADGPSDR
ncbi:hypothetical protein [Streptomyces sp. NPDC095613]|uniref:hypothetical protein n=1 Tax=Streptomyces sp. NPDC095613 TaxID=3155540 RepID=UPI0033277377